MAIRARHTTGLQREKTVIRLSLLRACALLATLACGVAHANASIAVGTLSSQPTPIFQDGFDFASGGQQPFAETDTFSFDLSATSSVDFTFSQLSELFGTPLESLTYVSATLDGLAVTPTSLTASTLLVDFNSLASGAHSLTLTYTVAADGPYAYDGAAVAAAPIEPVPEPSSATLGLAALALTGTLVRRRHG